MPYTRRVEGVLGQFSNRGASLTRKGGDSPPPLTSLLFQTQTSTLMTTEQILELAKTCGFDNFSPEDGVYWECWEEQLIEFAQQIAEIEYNRGRKDREEVEYSNRLNIGNTPIVPDETMEELLKNGVKK